MKSSEAAKSDRIRLWVTWVALLLLGVFFFTLRITHESLWMDEAFSVAVADLPFGDFWRASLQENSPPLYYFMLWVFWRIFGDSFLAARLFSAIGAFGVVLLGIGPIRMLSQRPNSRFSRMVSIPEEKWKEECLVELAPGEKKTMEFATQVPVEAGREITIVLQSGQHRILASTYPVALVNQPVLAMPATGRQARVARATNR